MAIKRQTLHLDEPDMKALARTARQETKATGIRNDCGRSRASAHQGIPAIAGREENEVMK